ncbi:MAG: hypothetical protein QMD97_05175 [Candidatus Aenigmarchaeota archaeon]|nr:hypothetical protein [Candidatus Aenigmarchaeota archaeon]
MEKTGLGRIALSGLIGAIISLQINLIINMAHGMEEAFRESHNAPELIVLVAALFYAFQASYYLL